MGQGASKAAKLAAENARESLTKQREVLNRVSPGGPFGYTGGKAAPDAVASTAQGSDSASAPDVSTFALADKPNRQVQSRLASYAPENVPKKDGQAAPPARKLEKVSPVEPMEMLFVKGKGVSSSPPVPAPTALSSAPVLSSTRHAAESTSAQLPEQEERITDTVPRDAEAAAVQREALASLIAGQGGEGLEGGGGGEASAATGQQTVAVQRLMASGPVPVDSSKLHEKNAETVSNLTDLSFRPTGDSVIQALPATSTDPGMRQLAVWTAMQANPDLLDTPAALARSSTAVAALGVLQLARGNTAAAPPGTVLKSGPVPPALPPPQPQEQAQSQAQQQSDALLVIERTADSLVPVGKTLDDVLIAIDPSLPAYAALQDVVAWGPRPPESSVYDQLIISERDDDLLLERAEVFELFARIRADPLYWTPDRLSQFYGTHRAWVEALVESVSPPLLTVHEGEAYGVYDIRPLEDVDVPVKSYRELWAEAEEHGLGREEGTPAQTGEEQGRRMQ